YAIFENMQGNHVKALKLARAALKLDPGDIGSGELILSDLVKRKKFKRIGKIVDAAVSQKHISGISKLLFADYYTLLGKPQKTLNIIAQLPKALKANPTYKLVAGKAFLRNGQGPQAVAMLRSFSAQNPNNIPALKYLLQGYLLTRNQDEYQATLEKTDRLEPNNFATRIGLVKLYVFRGKYDQAIKKLDQLKGHNDQQKLQKEIIVATIATNRKNYTRALAILAPLSKKYPKNGGIAMLYSHNLANDNQIDKAIRVSKAWAGQHPDNPGVKQVLGDMYLRIGDKDKARLQYEAILALKHKIPPKTEFHTRNNLAMIYLAKNQTGKAMEQARKALDMAPNNPAIIDTFARVLMKQGDTKKAVDHFNQALALLPDNDRADRASFTLGKAQALIQGGQKKQARKILQLLIRDNPEFSKTNKVREILSGL
ncbi:MAG: tetratricopeptide repeat protein, partial [Alphaproteobacteria bacterium]|nr:tetratricopeptide repeat protein [Alphaproteobacteria bacterium]